MIFAFFVALVDSSIFGSLLPVAPGKACFYGVNPNFGLRLMSGFTYPTTSAIWGIKRLNRARASKFRVASEI